MSISIGDKKKVMAMAQVVLIVEVREDIRLSEMVNYHLLICRL